jgi:hypothetical protein
MESLSVEVAVDSQHNETAVVITTDKNKAEEKIPDVTAVEPKIFRATAFYRRTYKDQLTLNRGLLVKITHQHTIGILQHPL